MAINGKYQLEQSPHGKAFRAVVKRLRGDPAFERVVKTWVVWDGSRSDREKPTTGLFPMLRLTPSPLGGQWETEGTHRIDMAIGVEIWMPGTRIDDPFDLYWSMKTPLMTPNFGSTDEGITQATLSRPATDPQLFEEQAALYLVGEIRLLIQAVTRP